MLDTKHCIVPISYYEYIYTIYACTRSSMLGQKVSGLVNQMKAALPVVEKMGSPPNRGRFATTQISMIDNQLKILSLSSSHPTEKEASERGELLDSSIASVKYHN